MRMRISSTWWNLPCVSNENEGTGDFESRFEPPAHTTPPHRSVFGNDHMIHDHMIIRLYNHNVHILIAMLSVSAPCQNLNHQLSNLSHEPRKHSTTDDKSFSHSSVNLSSNRSFINPTIAEVFYSSRQTLLTHS